MEPSAVVLHTLYNVHDLVIMDCLLRSCLLIFIDLKQMFKLTTPLVGYIFHATIDKTSTSSIQLIDNTSTSSIQLIDKTSTSSIQMIDNTSTTSIQMIDNTSTSIQLIDNTGSFPI